MCDARQSRGPHLYQARNRLEERGLDVENNKHLECRCRQVRKPMRLDGLMRFSAALIGRLQLSGPKLDGQGSGRR